MTRLQKLKSSMENNPESSMKNTQEESGKDKTEQKSSIKVTISGSGTSSGIPAIACKCRVCKSADPKDKRNRAAAFVTDGTFTIAIDAGPEFRIQALNYGLTRLDAVLVTHSHADHIHGLDDIRCFSEEKALPVYANRPTLANVKNCYDYVFKPTQKGGGKPQLDLQNAEIFNLKNPLAIGSMKIVPVPMLHGVLPVFGWRINNFAYLTDLSKIENEGLQRLYGIKCLVIDGLRSEEHETHCTFAQALDIACQTSAEQVFITHIAHDYSHAEICEILKEEQVRRPALYGKTVAPAYDGMEISI